MRKIISLVLVFMMCLGLVSCSSKESDENYKSYTIGYITDSNGLDIQRNQDVIDGINEAFKNYDFVLETKQATSSDKYTEACKTLLSSSAFDLVFSNAYAVSDKLLSIKNDFENVNFGLINYEDGSNTSLSVSYKFNEAAFLAGVLAAKETKTKKVSIIAAVESDNEAYIAGFVAGVRAVNKKIKIAINYANSYNDPSKGSIYAKRHIKNGVDIIFSVCGATTIGIENAIKETKKGTRIINSHYYDKTSKNSTLGNIVIDYKNSAYYICDRFLYDTFKDENVKLGLSDSVIDFVPNSDLVSSNLVKEIENFKNEISIKGLKIPSSIKKASKFTYKDSNKKNIKKKSKSSSKKSSKKSNKK